MADVRERTIRARTPDDLESWSDAVVDAMTQFTITPPTPSTFAGRMVTRTVGTTSMTSVASTGHVLRHEAEGDTPATVALVTLVTSGSAEVTQSGSRATVAAGDIALFSSSNEALVVCADDYQCFCIGVPIRSLPLAPTWWDDPERMIIRADSRLGAPLDHAISSLRTAADVVAGTSLRHVVDSAVHLVGTILLSDAARRGLEVDEALVASIDRFVELHLADPSLDAATIASAHHISRRSLYHLLGASGTTPAAMIRGRRLEAVRRELADPARRGRSVSECAAEWGFTNPSHFSVLFRTTYGVSPSRYSAEEPRRGQTALER
jgi:AraC-like DNA-binding protein